MAVPHVQAEVGEGDGGGGVGDGGEEGGGGGEHGDAGEEAQELQEEEEDGHAKAGRQLNVLVKTSITSCFKVSQFHFIRQAWQQVIFFVGKKVGLQH